MATKPKRPTAAQLDVLRKMRDGWVLVPSQGRVMSGFLCKDGRRTMVRVSENNMNELYCEGMIATAGDVWEPRYRLTDAGRAALEQP